MDTQWAMGKLNEHVDLTTLRLSDLDYGPYELTAGSQAAILASAQVVEKIMDRVTHGWRVQLPAVPDDLWVAHRAAAIRALAEISSADEVREHLGENAPTLNAAAMHPWAWEGARSLWSSGHYAEAVRASTTKLNAELQNKVGRRDVSEAALVQECFSDSEPSDRAPRLRPSGDDGGRTSKSVRRGIVALAEGCFGAIRNPLSHDAIHELTEQVALEQLATVSLLARWIDESTVHSAN